MTLDQYNDLSSARYWEGMKREQEDICTRDVARKAWGEKLEQK